MGSEMTNGAPRAVTFVSRAAPWGGRFFTASHVFATGTRTPGSCSASRGHSPVAEATVDLTSRYRK
jgi:hypothetical protein